MLRDRKSGYQKTDAISVGRLNMKALQRPRVEAAVKHVPQYIQCFTTLHAALKVLLNKCTGYNGDSRGA